jgi:hypothetical protein
MAKKELTVQGAVLKVTIAGGSGTAAITGAPSTKVLAEGKGVHKHNMSFQVTGATNGTCTQNAPYVNMIPATAVKNKVEGVAPVRKGDYVSVSDIPGILSGGGACVIAATIEVDNPGQTSVLGE